MFHTLRSSIRRDPVFLKSCQEKIFLLCAFSHDLWRNILHTYGGNGTVLLLIVFYCKMYFII